MPGTMTTCALVGEKQRQLGAGEPEYRNKRRLGRNKRLLPKSWLKFDLKVWHRQRQECRRHALSLARGREQLGAGQLECIP